MKRETITEIAESFGFELEGVVGPSEDDRSFRVYKGANQVFTGTEEAVRSFFGRYEKERPGLFVESLYGYRD